MRWDSLGLFWEDVPQTRARGAREIGPMPEIPRTGWVRPSEYPNLSAARILSYDVEAKDLELTSAGPGWGRGPGKHNIVGVSIAVHGASWYFPMRHETNPEENLDPEQTLRFLQHTLGDNRPKVGANLIYDYGSLLNEGVKVGGRQYDVQFAEALLNSETPSVSLESLSQKYLGTGKVSELLYEWLSTWMGGNPNEKQRKWIFKAPPSLVGPYAEGDAEQPLQILDKQWGLMHQRGVLDLFDIECRLIPLLVKMRMKGAPVDMNRAHEIYDTLTARAKIAEQELAHIAGMDVNPNSSDTIERAFKAHNIPIPMAFDKKTQSHKRSFAAPLLELVDHPITDKILEFRRTMKVANVFIKSYIINKQINGRVHCSFNPLKSDDSGARSGRFSSSDPNLQNIPVRTDEGKLVRKAFAAGQGAIWRKWDYSQIEYRLLAHHAVGTGASDLQARYRADPHTDYHEATIELVRVMTGVELDRRPAKTINFGLIYGMSKKELIKRLKLSIAEGNHLYESYHKAAPFIQKTMDAAKDEAVMYGNVQTLLGRRSDFILWGPARFDPGAPGLPYEEAILKYGAVERAFTHKALNRKLQGGAADIMKKAMVDCYDAGLFEEDACGIPILTVHDELDFEDFNDPDNKAWEEMRHIMENCVQTNVPIIIDDSKGPSWGEAD